MEQNQSNGLAVASMVIGIVSLLLSCCYGGFLGLIGLILGIIAISKGQKKGMAITGIITSVIAMIITIIAIGMGMSLIDELSKSSDDEVKKVNTEAASDTGDISNNDNTENDNSSEEESAVYTQYKVGDVIETKDVRITFLSADEFESNNEFLTPKEGYVYYRMEFEFENISDGDHSVSSMMGWECYADGYSMDQSFIGDDDLSATLSSGKKAKGSVYFEVPSDANEIELEYNDNVWTSNKIVFKVK